MPSKVMEGAVRVNRAALGGVKWEPGLDGGVEKWRRNICSCMEPTLRHIPKLERLLGALLCQRKGRPCGETAWLVQSHNQHLLTLGVERMGGTR